MFDFVIFALFVLFSVLLWPSLVPIVGPKSRDRQQTQHRTPRAKGLSSSGTVTTSSPDTPARQTRTSRKTMSSYSSKFSSPGSIAAMSEPKTATVGTFSDLHISKDSSNDGVRDFSGSSVQNRKKHFETMTAKPDVGDITSTTKPSNQNVEQSTKQIQFDTTDLTTMGDIYGVESPSETTHVGTQTPSVPATKIEITQESISQLQKDNADRYNAELQTLLKKYLPAPLFEPYPHLLIQPNQRVPTIIDMEIRRANALSARNVYHSHMQDEHCRLDFDHEHDKLLRNWLGKGKRVSNQMRKFAKQEKMKQDGGEDIEELRSAANKNGDETERGQSI